MDIRKVKKLIELLEESDIAEIEIHEGEESVRISRASTLAPTMIAAARSQRHRPAAAPAAAETHRRPQGARGTHHPLTHGRHLLPCPLARRQAVRDRRAKRFRVAKPCASSRR